MTNESGLSRLNRSWPANLSESPALRKLTLDSPRLYRCRCESPELRSFSLLAQLLPERTLPERAYLETKFAALVSYGLRVQPLPEVLPIGTTLHTMSLRRQGRHTAGRLEGERGSPRAEALAPDRPEEARDASCR